MGVVLRHHASPCSATLDAQQQGKIMLGAIAGDIIGSIHALGLSAAPGWTRLGAE